MSRALAFRILMGLALLSAVLPAGWSAWTRRAVQPINWLVRPLNHLTGSLVALSSVPTPEAEIDPDALLKENEQLRRLATHYAQLFANAEQTLEQVSGLRDQIGLSRVFINPVFVIGPGSDPSRDILRIAEGSFDGIRVGAWVAAADASPASGLEQLARQWLIGQVVAVRPYESEVMLFSDREFEANTVRIAPLAAYGSHQWIGGPLLLEGMGGGAMRIAHAALPSGEVEGEAVFLERGGALPIDLALGTVTAVRTSDKTGLHYDLEVASFGPARQLRQVFVIVDERLAE